jgi:hypothetical protein
MSTRPTPESPWSEADGSPPAASRAPAEARADDVSAGWGLTGYSDQSFFTPAGTLPERSWLARGLSAAPAGTAASKASDKHTRTLLAVRTVRPRAAEITEPQGDNSAIRSGDAAASPEWDRKALLAEISATR